MTQIQISEKTKKQLAKIGTKSSTWNAIINDLMNHALGCDRFWEDRFQ
jgi:hypothetical protein